MSSETETHEVRDPDKRVRFFDTTLRDGEQSPGIHLNQREKVEIAHQLARLGVDVIEAGFPISSPGDFEGVQAIAREVEGPIIAGLARSQDKDITTCWDAVKDAGNPRIHTFIATSDIHLKWKLRMDRAQVLAAATDAVRLARSLCEDVEFSCEDATRSDVAYVAEVVASAITEGATTINIPDTVGYTMPNEFQRLPAGALRALPQPGGRDAVGALPQRPGACGRQLPGGHARGRPAGRGLRQRHRRAGGQRVASKSWP